MDWEGGREGGSSAPRPFSPQPVSPFPSHQQQWLILTASSHFESPPTAFLIASDPQLLASPNLCTPEARTGGGT